MNSPDWVDDPLLPAGWKTAWYEIHGEKKTRYQKYRNPEGRILNSRAQAVRNMLSEGNCSEEEVALMKTGFLSDGWVQVHFLPEGWMVRKGGNLNKFLTPSLECFKTAKQAIEYMYSLKYDPEIIAKVKTTNFFDISLKRSEDTTLKRKSEQSTGSPSKICKTEMNDSEDLLWEDGDVTIPKGWKISIDKRRTKNNEFKSPKGHAFKNRVEGLKFMTEHRGIYTGEETEQLDDTTPLCKYL